MYRRGTDGTPEFVEVPEPTDEALQAVLHKIITRMMRLLTRRGVLVEEEGSIYMADNDADSDEARVLTPLQAAACTYRIAFGPRAGQKVLTVQGAMPRETDFEQPLCADIEGFSLHAAVRVAACCCTRRYSVVCSGRGGARSGPGRHPAPAGAAGQWLAREAPEVVSPHGLKPCTASQSLRLPPTRGCLPLWGPVLVIGL